MDLAFPVHTYHERLGRVLDRMRSEEIDAVLVTMPDNINWLTGYDTLGYLWFQCLLITDRLDEPRFLTRTMESAGVHYTSCIRDARYYDIVSEDPVAKVVDWVSELSLQSGRIGVELSSFTLLPYQWDQLRAALPDARFVDATNTVAEERVVKSTLEQEYQRKAARAADLALMAGVEALEPGISETAVAGIMAEALGAAGSEHAAIPPMIVSGERTQMIHALARPRAIGQGDLVILELAGVCNRYHAVLMRTASLGEPSLRARDVAAWLAEAHAAAIAEVRPGADPDAPNRACNAVLERVGLVENRAHRIGYSLGIAYAPTWLEPMMLAEGDPHTMQPGMSFTIEPNLWLPDEGFGVKLGETVACTADGPVSLSQLPHDLIVV